MNIYINKQCTSSLINLHSDCKNLELYKLPHINAKYLPLGTWLNHEINKSKKRNVIYHIYAVTTYINMTPSPTFYFLKDHAEHSRQFPKYSKLS